MEVSMRTLATRFFPAALATVACLAAGSAQAQRTGEAVTGLYLTGALGFTSYKVDTGNLASIGFATTSKDDSDWGWNFAAGYKITRNWAVELGYVDLGNFSAAGTF